MRQPTAKLTLHDLVVNGLSGLYTGYLDSKDFALTAATGKVIIRFKRRQSQNKLVAIFKTLHESLGDSAAIACLIDIVTNRDISTNNPYVRTDRFKSLEELRVADLPGGEDLFAYGQASFVVTSRP